VTGRVGVLAGGAVLLVLLELTLPVHGAFPAGTTLAFAFLGCLALIGVAKLLGAVGLQRPEPPDD
jgi:hypothetical protein